MRRTFTIMLLLSLFTKLAVAHTYVESSVLGSGNIVKLQIPSTGIYMLTYDQILAMGINPSKVRLLGYGGNLIAQDFTQARIDDVPSIPFFMQKGKDGVFNSGDYILFFGNGPLGWKWDNSSKTYQHTRNCYADFGCYFLSDNAGEQLLLTTQESPVGGTPFDVYTYTALQLHELDQRNLIDLEGAAGGGREWYGEILTSSNAKLTIPFSFSGADTEKQLVCRVDAAATASTQTSLQASVADKTGQGYFKSISSEDHAEAMTGSITITSAQPTGNSLPVTLKYVPNSTSDAAYLNYVEMQVPCTLRLKDNYLFIRNTEHIGSPFDSRYHLLGADANTQIWNITHPASAYLMDTTWVGDTLCWIGSNQEPQLFAAVRVNNTGWSAPASRGKITNQNLHKDLIGKHHVIVAPDELRSAAERLKAVHEQYNATEKWIVVSDYQVYNEFSSGTPDASAIRWMMKYLYDTAPDDASKPMTLLLFGDGSFDNRQILKTSPKPVLLTYQAINSTVETKAYATDDYFGWLHDNDGLSGSQWEDAKATMEIGVGRLPVNTYEEATNVVNKIALYLSNTTADSWKQQLCFLSDDGDGGLHMSTVDIAAQSVAAKAPSYVVNKIYLDAYEQTSSASGESYPLAYNSFCNLLQTGVMLMDYAGHGSANNICSEMFLTRKQVENMSNLNQGLWALASCSFSHFDQTKASTAEVAVLNPTGGAIGVISAGRTVYATPNGIINNYLCQNLFYHTDPFTYPYSIGEALRLAKNQCGYQYGSVNKLPYVLLGDPSLHLNHPSQYEVKIYDIPQTMHALDLVTIRGYISTGDTLSSTRRDTVDFEGELSISIYDKSKIVYTRDNDETDPSKKQIRSFEDYPNLLFSGKATVEQGLFTITFRMPKDIRYNTGAGRIVLYAKGEADSQFAEAMGYNTEQFMVGGSSPLHINDNEGPKITMYLNDSSFVSGDNVNATPHFYATLSDENGINTVGSGIGHDLKLVIDNNTKQTYILNKYYTAISDSYQRGKISYILPQLTNGSHTLSFRAWDMLNNSTTKTMGFTVDNEMGPNLKSLLVYPNPVSKFGTLNMYLTHDRPDDLVSMEIAFYNTMGQKVWSTYRSLYDTIISFDMSEAMLPAGTYIYQFIIQTSTQSSEKHSGRIIVY